ncbi:MAG: energy-coupling factor transporter ATPase [Oscillospiraceae bacterium]|nr:energy-coupling factor transporter ATPase [Oscillospiraceae bacterium]
MTVLKTENLTHYYSNGMSGEVAAIKNINIEIEKGELVGIIGHTGSGKSTLLQHFNGLLKPDAGRVLLEGRDIWESKESIRSARFKVGLCFQYPEYQLFEETVYKDIAFGPKNMGLDNAETDRRVRRAAQFVGLRDEYLEKSPFDLSGGEKRRAAIAGVMAMEPEVLILDEPTAGLDPYGREKILALVKAYREQTGNTVMMVSHSMEDVAKIADRVLVLNNSEVAMFGTVAEVYSKSAELSEMGLSVPQITKIFSALRERGFAVSDSVFTVEQGVSELMRFFEGGSDRDK